MNGKSSNRNKWLKTEWWKIAGFSLGVILIAAAATYALTTRSGAAPSGPLANGNVPSLVSNKSAADTLGIDEMTWTKNLDSVFVNNDYVFVILPKGDDDATKTVTTQVTGAVDKIQAKGTSVSTVTLDPSDPELSITADRLAIKQLPAVLIISKTGYGAIVTQNFDEVRLLQIYLMLTQQSICPPGSSSGCCPK